MTTAPTRRLFEVALKPLSGARFQPTGFPDIGAATFQRPYRENGDLKHRDCLLVESPQSTGNHLEAMGWDMGTESPVATLSGLPYVRVVAADDGRYLTSSRTEAHRLASAFVKHAELDGTDMRDVIRERLELRDDTPLAPRAIAGAVLALDPLCLIHGVFFAEKAYTWPGQPKIARALSGFIEAVDVEPVVSGGVKRDEVKHESSEGGAAKEGYGSIPFHRIEYTASEITASFSLDLAQLASYGLSQPATGLLEAIALWEVRTLIDGGLRLRTACDLVPIEPEIVDSQGDRLDQAGELQERIRELIELCGPQLGTGGPLEVVWGGPKKPKKAP